MLRELGEVDKLVAERYGRRMYDNGTCDAVGFVPEFFNPSSGTLTLRVDFFDDPN